MKYIAPNYYKEFKCIADKCRHNCCIGWEIDIDEDTYNKYKNVQCEFGKVLNDNIEITNEYACFKLDGKGRCSFLNENNLCDIILNLGEDALCQICTDHPRFRNYYSNCTEIGLGLCCEEAARIILTQTEPVYLTVISDDKSTEPSTESDEDFFEFREKIFELLQDSNKSLQEKVITIIKISRCNFPNKNVSDWADIFLSLERLDDYWTILLNELKRTDTSNVVIPQEYDKTFENLLVYFTYRHLDNYETSQKLLFVVLSYLMITYLCKMHIKKYGKLTLEDIIDYSRMYSSEIEYSDENLDSLIELL